MSLAKYKLLNEKILFLDGLTRAGKFLLGKIIGGFEGVEYFVYNPTIEHFFQLGGENIISKEDASALLSIYLNMTIYDYSIGRTLNLRKSDSSSIFNSFEVNRYLRRVNKTDGIDRIDEIVKNNRYSTFMVHECIQYYDIIKSVAPNSKVITIRRNPIDIAYSWYIRGWGDRFGVDPLSFVPAVKGKQIPIPTFAKNWGDKYKNMNNAERVVSSVLHLAKMEKANIEPHDLKLTVYYENLITAPLSVVDDISAFLIKKPHKSISNIIKKECKGLDFEAQRVIKEKTLKDRMQNSVLFDKLKRYESYYISDCIKNSVSILNCTGSDQI
jgi:hypothetical protein